MKKTFQPKAIASLLVLFLALSVWFAPAALCGNDRFTIAVIPDTQNYVDYTKTQPASSQDFLVETQFLAKHKKDLNLIFVTHVGDVVQHGIGTNGLTPGVPGYVSYGYGAEWDQALSAMKILADADIPFGMVPGNHDYDNYSYATPVPGNRPLSGTFMWNKYFGSKSYLFGFQPWYGGASDHLAYNPGLSSFQVFKAGGKDFLHLSLEMEPSNAALQWAQDVIDAHPGYATIVTTHSVLSPPTDLTKPPLDIVPAIRNEATYLTTDLTPGSCSGNPQPASPGGCNNAQQVWDKFISRNPRIFMVLCGHSFTGAAGENIRIDKNSDGLDVYQLLTDYQGNQTSSRYGVPDAGGDGWIRLMEFDLDAGIIHFRTYSPVLNKYAGLGHEATFGQPPAFSDFVLPVPVQVYQASSARNHGHDSAEYQELGH